MRFVRYQHSGTPCWGVEEDDTVHQLPTVPSYEQLTNPSYVETVRMQMEYGGLHTHPLDEVNILPPVASPGKIVSVGLNYKGHAEEQDAEIPEQPLLFSKSPSAVVGQHDPIVLPKDVDQVDYEVELAIVMGRTARNVEAAEATEYIAGYTIINDISARDAQFNDGQFFRGKSYDTFAPLGPVLRTGDFDPNQTDIKLRLNGERKQDSNTSGFIFDVSELVEYITNVMTLEPGDVISTGTPAGVGIFSDPPELLKPGDTVEAEIEGIGTLTNSTVAELD